MKKHMRKRLVTAILALALAAGSGGNAAAGSGGSASGGSTEPFVPFVTDFGRTPSPAPTEVGAPTEPYVPFVTDFGRSPAPAPAVVGAPSEPVVPTTDVARSWEDLAIGAGLGIAFATLLGAALVAVRSRRPSEGLRHEGS